jgi:hypothetical protein
MCGRKEQQVKVGTGHNEQTLFASGKLLPGKAIEWRALQMGCRYSATLMSNEHWVLSKCNVLFLFKS